MTPDPLIPSSYFQNLDTKKWKILFENNVMIGVKSLTDKCELTIVPNNYEQAILVMKKNSVVIVLVKMVPNNKRPFIDVMWDNAELLRKTQTSINSNNKE